MIDLEIKSGIFTIPDLKTYLARFCINSAGQVGGKSSPGSRLNLNVSSNP